MSYSIFNRHEINNELLIKGVEKRPALYNKASHEYTDFAVKAKLWEEIAITMYPNTWEKMTPDRKDKIVRDIQKRWKNLRACFTREVRLQRTSIDPRRRQYIYYNKLKFLIPSVAQELAYSRTEDNDSQEETEEDYDIQEGTIDVPLDIPISTQEVTVTTSNNELRSSGAETFPKFEYQRDHCYESEDIDRSGRLSNANYDADTNFALSLVPWLKAVPFNNKLDAQVAVLETLKRFVHREEKKDLKESSSYTDSPEYTITVKEEVDSE